jgi:hypothetical protein
MAKAKEVQDLRVMVGIEDAEEDRLSISPLLPS